MLGFGAIGQFALGQPSPLPAIPQHGGGKRHDFPSYIPQPAYDAKPNKPFRPIWDIRRRQEEEARRKALEPAPLPYPAPLPPLPAHAQPAPIVLPRFDHLAPQDPLGLVRRMADARDMTDAADAAKSLEDLTDAVSVLVSLGLIRKE